MQNNVIDIIIHLIRNIEVGKRLNEVSTDQLKGYDRSEISAAYSWIIQKKESGELDSILNRRKAEEKKGAPHRVLHIAERMMITPEAYGYLLELMNYGLLDYMAMERIIESVMLQSTERISLEKMKTVVASIFFEKENNILNPSFLLKGNESIN
ncbi:MAG TPA: DUF494 family protein [Balneolales bacterium]|nr:DUF494 family protein [Balneolales bacterium]